MAPHSAVAGLFAGAFLGVPFAYAAVFTLASLIPPVNVPYTMTLTPDLRVLAATGIVGLLVGVAMSALPIWMAMRPRVGAHSTWDRTIVGATNRWGRALKTGYKIYERYKPAEPTSIAASLVITTVPGRHLTLLSEQGAACCTKAGWGASNILATSTRISAPPLDQFSSLAALADNRR